MVKLKECSQQMVLAYQDSQKKLETSVEENIALKKQLKEQSDKVQYLEPKLINQKKIIDEVETKNQVQAKKFSRCIDKLKQF